MAKISVFLLFSLLVLMDTNMFCEAKPVNTRQETITYSGLGGVSRTTTTVRETQRGRTTIVRQDTRQSNVPYQTDVMPVNTMPVNTMPMMNTVPVNSMPMMNTMPVNNMPMTTISK